VIFTKVSEVLGLSLSIIGYSTYKRRNFNVLLDYTTQYPFFLFDSVSRFHKKAFYLILLKTFQLIFVAEKYGLVWFELISLCFELWSPLHLKYVLQLGLLDVIDKTFLDVYLFAQLCVLLVDISD